MSFLNKQLFTILSSIGVGLALILLAFQKAYWNLPLDIAMIFMAYYMIFYYLRKHYLSLDSYRRTMPLLWTVLFAMYLTMHMLHFEFGLEYSLTSIVLSIAFLGMCKSAWFFIDYMMLGSESHPYKSVEQWGDGLLLGLVLLVSPFAINLHNIYNEMPTGIIDLINTAYFLMALIFTLSLLISGLIKKMPLNRTLILLGILSSSILAAKGHSVPLFMTLGLLVQWGAMAYFFIWLLDQMPILERKQQHHEWDNVFKAFKDYNEGVLLVTHAQGDGYAVERVNRKMETMLGYKREQLNERFVEIFDPNLLNYRGWQTEEPLIHEDITLFTASSKPLQVNLMVQPYKLGQEKAYFVHVIDLSNQLENEKKLTVYERRLYELAYINPVTKLKNLEYLKAMVDPFAFSALGIVRITDIQVVANALGEEAVAAYLQVIAKRLKSMSAFVYQLDRAAFVLLFEGDREEVLKEIKVLEEAMTQPVVVDQTAGQSSYEMSYCMDLAEVQDSETFCEKIDRSIKRCELALEYKQLKRLSETIEFTPYIGQEMERHNGISLVIGNALENEAYYLVYQPIINLTTGKTSGVEAFLRWDNDLYGKISPAEFIPMLETSGKIHAVGFYVFEQAFEDFKRILLKKGFEDARLHVNISLIQLMNPDFFDHFTELMSDKTLKPDQIVLEVADVNQLEDLSTSQNQLRRLHDYGVRVAFDDFGSHKSSLNSLGKFRPTYIKIDRRFFENIHKSVSDAILLSGIIALASKMEIEIIAESVESYEQMRFILNQKCRYIQGFYFEKPMLIEDLVTQIEKNYSNLIHHKVHELLENPLEQMTDEERFIDYKGVDLGLVETDANGVILNVNATIQKWCHATYESLYLKNIEEWFVKPLQFQAFIQNGQFVEREDQSVEFFTLEHNTLHMSVSLKWLRKAENDLHKMIWIFENVEVIHQHKRGILDNRESYKKVFHLSPLPIVIWDMDYHIIDYNHQAQALFGVQGDAASKNMSHWVAENSLERFRRHYDELILNGSDESEFDCYVGGDVTKRMTCKWVSQCQVNDAGLVLRIVTILEDVTARKQTENMKKVFAQQERLAAVGHLAAGIAHEINNPLSYMLTNTDYLLKLKPQLEALLAGDDLLREDLVDILDSYKEGLGHIKTIVSDLKSFVHHSAQEEREWLSLNSLVDKVINIAHNEIKYTSNVTKHFEEGLPDIPVNSAKIQQVLLNLILNANHAIVTKSESEPGFVGTIDLRTFATETHVCCEIVDNGCGMTEAVIQKIFEPFFTTKPEGIGTGLGLPISKEIIEQYHGGLLEVASIRGEGTTFRICLPLEGNESQGGSV